MQISLFANAKSKKLYGLDFLVDKLTVLFELSLSM